MIFFLDDVCMPHMQYGVGFCLQFHFPFFLSFHFQTRWFFFEAQEREGKIKIFFFRFALPFVIWGIFVYSFYLFKYFSIIVCIRSLFNVQHSAFNEKQQLDETCVTNILMFAASNLQQHNKRSEKKIRNELKTEEKKNIKFYRIKWKNEYLYIWTSNKLRIMNESKIASYSNCWSVSLHAYKILKKMEVEEISSESKIPIKRTFSYGSSNFSFELHLRIGCKKKNQWIFTWNPGKKWKSI